MLKPHQIDIYWKLCDEFKVPEMWAQFIAEQCEKNIIFYPNHPVVESVSASDIVANGFRWSKPPGGTVQDFWCGFYDALRAEEAWRDLKVHDVVR